MLKNNSGLLILVGLLGCRPTSGTEPNHAVPGDDPECPDTITVTSSYDAAPIALEPSRKVVVKSGLIRESCSFNHNLNLKDLEDIGSALAEARSLSKPVFRYVLSDVRISTGYISSLADARDGHVLTLQSIGEVVVIGSHSADYYCIEEDASSVFVWNYKSIVD